jgi:hypothetical protein
MRPARCITTLAVISLFALLGIRPANAFQIHPNVSPKDSRLTNIAGFQARVSHQASDRFLGIFKSPVHEAITQSAFGCVKDNPIDCAGEKFASSAVIWGIRWNDDPPFRMKDKVQGCDCDQTIRFNTQPSCWYRLFKDAEKKAAKGKVFGPGYVLLYRIHFGDLQFVHAMASMEGESASTTRAHIMMWLEFTWQLATDTIRRDRYMKELGLGDLGTFFPGDLSASILFAQGYPPFQNEKISEVALGSLLHLVQDSFSRSHVTRANPTGADCEGMPNVPAPGAITQFHSYANQEPSKHDEMDRAHALRVHEIEDKPNVIDVSRTIVQLWQRKTPWEEVHKYFDYVFALDPAVKDAGPGYGFEK